MKSIKISFERKSNKHPERGSYINLADAVIGKKFKRDAVVSAFYKLVNQDEYEYADRIPLIRHLTHLTNTLEDRSKRGSF